VQEVLVSSVVLVLLSVTLVASFTHYPFYPCCFHQLSYAIRHWNFRELPPTQPKEFWGYSYVTALVAAATGMRDDLAMVLVSSSMFVLANYLCCLLWGTTVAAWMMVINYWWIDGAAQGLTEPLFMALLLGSFLALRRERWAITAILASAATAVRPVGIFALIAIGIMSLRRKPRQLAITTAIGLAVGTAYMIPMVLVFRNPLANVAGYQKSDWGGPLPLKVPLLPLIKSAEYTHAFAFSGRLHILYSCVNLAWVLFALAGTIAMAVRKRFWVYAKRYPGEAIFAGTFALFLFSYSAPMWEFYFFPRFVIPLIPFLLFVFSDHLPLDRRILWGVALLNVTASVGPKVTTLLRHFS
jgi:MFS family permease